MLLIYLNTVIVPEESIVKEDVTNASEADMETKLRISQFMAKINVPFKSGPDILDLIKDIVANYDRETILNTNLSDTSIKTIVHNCIGATLKEEVMADLIENPFSLMLDDTSDIYGGKYVGLIVRYTRMNSDLPVTKMLGIIKIKTSSTGETHYKLLKEEVFNGVLNYDHLLEKNLVGLCTDNAPNMISSDQAALANRLKNDYPHIVVVRDLCHLYDLICEEALKEFPLYVINFIKKVCSYFRGSAQRKACLSEIQLSAGVLAKNVIKIKKYVDTRWLSLRECTDSIIKLWRYLLIFVDKEDTPFEESFNSETQLYLSLLSCLLNKIDYYCKYFQEPNLFYDRIIDKMRNSYKINDCKNVFRNQDF